MSPIRPADVDIVAGNRAEPSSAKATVAISSPAAIRGSTASHSAASPASVSKPGTSTAVDRNGLTSSARPISSIAMPISTGPAPAPPYFSSISRPVRPMAASSRHTIGSKPVSVAICAAHLRLAGVTGHQVGDRAAQRPLFLAHREGRAGRHQLVTARADRRLAHWLAKNAWDTPAFGTTRSKPWNAPGIVSIWQGTPAAVSRSA